MKKKVLTYILLTICSLSLLVDATFALKAFLDLKRLVPIEGTVTKATIEKYRATNKIPVMEVALANNGNERIYQKFGSFSLRWLLQPIPREQDKISYYRLDQIEKERGVYIVGVSIGEKCPKFKLLLDVYASYAYNTVPFLLNYAFVFIALAALGSYWDFTLLNENLNKILVSYSFLKLIIYALFIS